MLAADNTYAGPTTIAAGSLQVGSGTAAGTLAGNVVDNGNLTFNRSTAYTFPGNISGTGSLTKSGTGPLSFTGTLSYSGVTTLTAGTLTLASPTPFLPGGISMTGGISTTGGTFDLGNQTIVTGNVNVEGTGIGNLTNGTLDLSGKTLYFRAGTLDANLTGTGNVEVWLVAEPDALILLGGNNTINSSSGCSLRLRPYLTAAPPTIKLTSPGALGQTTINGNNIYAEDFAGTIDANGQAGIKVGRIMIYSGSFSKVINSNTNTTASFLSEIVLISNGSEFGGPGNIVFNGSVTYLGGITKIGAGTVVLAANNTYTGPTIITAGTLQIGNGGATGSVKGDITDNASLIFNRAPGSAFPAIGSISGNGSLTIQGGDLTTNQLRLATLSITAGQSLTISANSPPSAVTSLTLLGTLDLTNNAMVVANGNLVDLRSASAGGTLKSTTLTQFTTLAVFPNSLPSGASYYNSYADIALLPTDTILRYTYTGDTNIDGILDATDLANLIEGLSTGASGWQSGDLNYDGLVNTTDLFLFTTALNAYQLNPIPLGSPTDAGQGLDGSVPEPASLTSLLALALLSRRRRT